MFNFADVDRDGMFDLIYLPETEFGLTIYYNKLSTNYDNRNSKVDTSSDNWQVCGDTNRILWKNAIFSPFGTLDKFVIKQSLDDGEGIEIVRDEETPRRIFFGDITSDGYPDLLATVKLASGVN